MGAGALAAGVFGGAVFLLAGRKFSRGSCLRGRFALWASLLFLGAFVFRVVLGYYSQGFTTDTDTFKSWANIANTVGFQQIYHEDIFLDYPPGYLYVLVFLEKLRLLLGLPLESQGYTLLIKLPSILADLFCAGVVLHLAKDKLGERAALFLAAAYLFCPAVYLNSAQWGQADSFCAALVLCSVLLLYRERYVPAALLFGVSIACKPQMLVFAPLYLFFAIKQRRWLKLLLGIALTVGAVLLLALPFTQGFNFLWLLERYQATLDYYNYYSVNAYNFWSLIGWNWQTLPAGLAGELLDFVGPVIATLCCGAAVFGSRRKEVVFYCPALLMAVMYAFSVKMHERYLFPALLFTLLAYLTAEDRGLLRSYAALATASYANVAYVLWQFREFYGSYDPNTPLTRFFSLGQLAAIGSLLWVGFRVYLRGEARPGAAPQPKPLVDRRPVDSAFRPRDWALLGAVTVVYACFAFWGLGDRQTALTSWTPAAGESVTLIADGEVDTLLYLPGIAPDEAHYAARVGVNVQVETSQDGVNWVSCGNLTDGSVFAWKQYALSTPGRYVRLTALDGSVTLNEAGLKYTDTPVVAAVTSQGPGAELLTDEQDVVPLETTYKNSTYFDEIYHARTAYEHILGLEPYENTHPTLGKLIISLGIRLFGMNPFGWRFMGALFGVLMLPVLYHLLKQLFGRTRLAFAGTVLFAFDFMHFTQTRIATIDTYAVFFLLLMYDAMVVFLKGDVGRDSWKRLLPPLLVCGVFTGLGIAAKWTAVYGALGLAGLFFGKLAFTLWEARRRGEDVRPLARKCLHVFHRHPLWHLLRGVFAHHHAVPQRGQAVVGLLELPDHHVQLPRPPGGHPLLCLPLVRVALRHPAYLVLRPGQLERLQHHFLLWQPLAVVGLPPRPGGGRLPLVEGAPPLGGGGAGGVWLGVPALGAGAKADLYLPLLHGGALPGGGPVRGVFPAVRERPLCPAAHLPRGIGVPGRHAAAGGLCRRVLVAVHGVLPGALRRPHHPGICRRLGAV